MSYYYRDVQRFHDKFGLVTPPSFTLLESDLHTYRVKFLEEEFHEYVDSCLGEDLATAIDSLVDLIYVTCGTLIMHGVTPVQFDELVIDEDGLHDVESIVFNTEDEPYKLKPSFLTPKTNNEFTRWMHDTIRAYSQVHQASKLAIEDLYSQEELIKKHLGALYLGVLNGASLMGLSPEIWNEFWDDVQEANMRKERVLRVEDSKRGSLYDVRKPPGWVPPRTEEILRKHT